MSLDLNLDSNRVLTKTGGAIAAALVIFFVIAGLGWAARGAVRGDATDVAGEIAEMREDLAVIMDRLGIPRRDRRAQLPVQTSGPRP